MRKLLIILIIALTLCLITLHVGARRASDPYLRDRIVKLTDAEGASCTGVEVRSPKGVIYTLTAGHCRVLLNVNKQMTAIDEAGNKYTVTLVVEDLKADLLLLTAIGHKSVPIAGTVYDHERVKAITHGRGWKAFRTDGELVQEDLVIFGESVITTPAELDECVARGPKTVVYNETDPLFGTHVTICTVQTQEMLSTTMILPGSSGGPLFNMQGEVVGIASAGSSEDPMGRFVRLADIQDFMKTM